MAKIIAIGLANPERCLTQAESWAHLQRLRRLSPLEKKYYKQFMLDDGIQTRYLALPELEDIFEEDQDKIIKRYETAAPKLATAATLQAIHKTGQRPKDLAFIATASCTGYLCPGLSSYIIEQAALRPEINALDLQGMGCGAALPALAAANNYLAQSKEPAFALVNCTEVCSAAIVWDDDLGLILSNSIFADGSASVILSNHPDLPGAEIIDYAAITFPEHREDLRFGIDKGRLRNQLSAIVPQVAAKGAKTIVEQILKRNHLQKKDITFWALHSGGRKVLETIAEKLGLSELELKYSRETLRQYGNLSSPSVLFALESIIRSNSPQTGDYGMLLSFGAGFSCYGMLIKWR